MSSTPEEAFARKGKIISSTSPEVTDLMTMKNQHPRKVCIDR